MRNMRLAEDTSVSGRSELSQNRIRTDHFKGFSAEHRQTFYAENARQMAEKNAMLEAERARAAGYAAHVKNMYELSRKQAAVRATHQRRQELKLKAEGKAHARAHRARENEDRERIMNQKVTE